MFTAYILDETALIVLPTLLGMVWAFQGNGKWRIEQLELLFTGQMGGFAEIIDHLPFTSANLTLPTAGTSAATTEVEFLKQYADSDITLKARQVEKLMKIVSYVCITDMQYLSSFMYVCMNVSM